MKVAIHQPHYFPWLGYFDKIAKVDRFVIMDEVQFVPRSYMSRNSFLNNNGEVVYQSLIVSKVGYREKALRQIEVMDCATWQNKQRVFFDNNYGRFPYYNQVMKELEHIFEKEYVYLLDVQLDTIRALCCMLNISTELVLQSSLTIEHGIDAKSTLTEEEKQHRRCLDVIHICEAAGATQYITGCGKSLEFVDPKMFEQHQIQLALQEYQCPIYPQKYTAEFVPNISALDMLLNCGIEESRRIFWENVNSTHEFE